MLGQFRKSLAKVVLGLAACSLCSGISSAAGLMTVNGIPAAAPKIQSHHVVATVEDGYAITQVDQVFRSSAQQDLEARYHFPVPDKAAVSEFTVWIDGQPVVGEVLEKERASEVYQQEKDAGRESGISARNRHYNFSVKVSPLRAGQDTRIRLVYMQPIDLDTGVGRYVYPLEDGGTDEQARAFWTSDSAVQQSFSFRLDLRSGYPVAGVRVPAHPQAGISQHSDQQWQVSLGHSAQSPDEGTPALEEGESTASVAYSASSAPAVASLERDIVVYWRLVDGLPGSVDLVTHKEPGAEHGTFMLTLTPGDDLAPVSAGRDWMFVLDMSGSMKGKYHTLTEGVQQALSTLRAEDRFRIVRFNDQASEMTRDWVNTTPENIRFWSDKLAATRAGGSTNLYSGIRKGLKSLDADRTSALILVTDGEANVGVTEKKQFLKLLEKYDVRLFTAVMGNGANRPLLEAMTTISNGFAVSVSNSDDIVGKLIEFTSKATHQALRDIELKISGVKTSDLTSSAGSSLYRGEQLVLMGHYRGGGDASVSLKGKVSGESRQYSTHFNFPLSNTSNPEIERLWAYARIRELQDTMDYLGDDSEHRSALVDLATTYSLVTDYTSMVVMRDEQFEARGIERKNRDRRQREAAAAQQRAASAPVSRRVDSAQPAFSQPRASHSGGGGGALILELLLLLPFAAWLGRRRQAVRPAASYKRSIPCKPLPR